MTSTSEKKHEPVSYRADGPNGASVIIDQDGGCCWAYYQDNERKIVGDCWLFNVAGVDQSSDSSHSMQRKNPPRFAREADAQPPTLVHHLRVRWKSYGTLPRAVISCDDSVIAWVSSGSKPGGSVFASLDGPLARTLSKDEARALATAPEV